MDIFTNWIFWVALATIVFIFALIGFLSDRKKKGKNGKVQEGGPSVAAKLDSVDDVSLPNVPMGDKVADLNSSKLNEGLVNNDTSNQQPLNVNSQDVVSSAESSLVEEIPTVRNQVSVDSVNMNAESTGELANQVTDESAQPTVQSVAASAEEVSVNIVPNVQGVQTAGDSVDSSAGSGDVWNQ